MKQGICGSAGTENPWLVRGFSLIKKNHKIKEMKDRVGIHFHFMVPPLSTEFHMNLFLYWGLLTYKGGCGLRLGWGAF